MIDSKGFGLLGFTGIGTEACRAWICSVCHYPFNPWPIPPQNLEGLNERTPIEGQQKGGTGSSSTDSNFTSFCSSPWKVPGPSAAVQQHHCGTVETLCYPHKFHRQRLEPQLIWVLAKHLWSSQSTRRWAVSKKLFQGHLPLTSFSLFSLGRL